mmetsp:Transcript_10771/g.40438  ORF Transcript_10771/g.40438 Transcript_10771/m.40438 type:complete len:663 (-) Transcript_10771:560-2548(-)
MHQASFTRDGAYAAESPQRQQPLTLSLSSEVVEPQWSTSPDVSSGTSVTQSLSALSLDGEDKGPQTASTVFEHATPKTRKASPGTYAAAATLDFRSSINKDLWDSIDSEVLDQRQSSGGYEAPTPVGASASLPVHPLTTDSLSSTKTIGLFDAGHPVPERGASRGEPRRAEPPSNGVGLSFPFEDDHRRLFSPSSAAEPAGLDFDAHAGYPQQRHAGQPSSPYVSIPDFFSQGDFLSGPLGYHSSPSLPVQPHHVHPGHGQAAPMYPRRSISQQALGHQERGQQNGHLFATRSHSLSDETYAGVSAHGQNFDKAHGAHPQYLQLPQSFTDDSGGHFNGVPRFRSMDSLLQPQVSLHNLNVISANGVHVKSVQAVQAIDPVSGQAKMFIAAPEGSFSPAHLLGATQGASNPMVGSTPEPPISRGPPSGPSPSISKRESSDDRPLNVSEEAVDGLIYEIHFKRSSRYFFLHPRGPRDVKTGDHVKVEADRGEDLGKVVATHPVGMFMGEDNAQPTAGFKSRYASLHERKRLIRHALDEEVAALDEKCREEEAVLKICRQKAKFRGLPMTVIDAEYQFDRHKLTFFFEAERRIDFRELVRDLFAVYKTRIWLQQVESVSEGTSTASASPSEASSTSAAATASGASSTVVSSTTSTPPTPTQSLVY